MFADASRKNECIHLALQLDEVATHEANDAVHDNIKGQPMVLSRRVLDGNLGKVRGPGYSLPARSLIQDFLCLRCRLAM